MKRLRILRGGAWQYYPNFQKAHRRHSDVPSFRKSYGFRIALPAP
jgi:formylglycine-generating enzyme required for sulfatase activity